MGAVALAWALAAPFEARAWTWPADGPVVREFSLGDNPYAGGQHRGIDVGLDDGASVRAPASGEVTFAGAVPTHGLTVTIATPDGHKASLTHLGPLLVRRGDAVAEGIAVAAAGSSGTPSTTSRTCTWAFGRGTTSTSTPRRSFPPAPLLRHLRLPLPLRRRCRQPTPVAPTPSPDPPAPLQLRLPAATPTSEPTHAPAAAPPVSAEPPAEPAVARRRDPSPTSGERSRPSSRAVRGRRRDVRRPSDRVGAASRRARRPARDGRGGRARSNQPSGRRRRRSPRGSRRVAPGSRQRSGRGSVGPRESLTRDGRGAATWGRTAASEERDDRSANDSPAWGARLLAGLLGVAYSLAAGLLRGRERSRDSLSFAAVSGTETPRKILVAVAWPYASGPRHIGHVAGFGVPSDTFARYHRLRGNDVLMVSGTDEHGTPVMVAADAAGESPRETAERFSTLIREDLRDLGLSYDLFTRTTTRNHYLVTQDLFRTLYEKGYVVERETLGAFSASTATRSRIATSRGRARSAGSRARAATSATTAATSSTPVT